MPPLRARLAYGGAISGGRQRPASRWAAWGRLLAIGGLSGALWGLIVWAIG